MSCDVRLFDQHCCCVVLSCPTNYLSVCVNLPTMLQVHHDTLGSSYSVSHLQEWQNAYIAMAFCRAITHSVASFWISLLADVHRSQFVSINTAREIVDRLLRPIPLRRVVSHRCYSNSCFWTIRCHRLANGIKLKLNTWAKLLVE